MINRSPLLSLSFYQYQRGAALMVSLIFLLILTIVSAAAMQSATLQERMAGNAKDINLAFQAAEAALREAEAQLSQINIGTFDGSNGLYLSCADPADARTACVEPDWSDHSTTGWRVVPDSPITNASRQPEYVIEELSNVADPNAALDSDQPVATLGYYLITARGFGASDRSMVVLSTTFKRNN